MARIRKPVILVFSQLVADAQGAGHLEEGDPEVAANHLLAAMFMYLNMSHLGNSVGGTQPTPEQFVRFCLNALGANLPTGWEDQFHLTDAERARKRSVSLARIGQ